MPQTEYKIESNTAWAKALQSCTWESAYQAACVAYLEGKNGDVFEILDTNGNLIAKYKILEVGVKQL